MKIFRNRETRCFVARLLPAAGMMLLLSVTQAPAWGQQYEDHKLVAFDNAEDDSFGDAVALSGDVALIGAPWSDAGFERSGSAYVYRYDLGSGTWVTEAKLIASDAERSRLFGWSVAVEGDRAMVSSPGGSGAVYEFRYDAVSGTWNEENKLVPSDIQPLDFFGRHIALDGDLLLVGEDGPGFKGAAYLFRYDSGSGTWNEEQKLLASDGQPDDSFGFSVDICDSVALIGAMSSDDWGFHSGSAYVFRYDSGSATWKEEQKLLASDGAYYDQFGWSVAMSADLLLIGANRADYTGEESGAVYAIQYDSGSGTWIEKQKFVAADTGTDDFFGSSVALSGDLALIGAKYSLNGAGRTGEAYKFRYDPGSETWKEEAKLSTLDGLDGDEFGQAVAISGDTFLIGAPEDDIDVLNCGSAYIFGALGPFAVDVKINGQDGPVFLTLADTITCTIDISAGSHAGTPVDVWALAIYGYAATSVWSCGNYGAPSWSRGWNEVFFTGGLVDMTETLFNAPVPNQPAGFWSVYLLVDMNPDGLLDVGDVLEFDDVSIIVQP